MNKCRICGIKVMNKYCKEHRKMPSIRELSKKGFSSQHPDFTDVDLYF